MEVYLTITPLGNVSCYMSYDGLTFNKQVYLTITPLGNVSCYMSYDGLTFIKQDKYEHKSVFQILGPFTL